MEHRRISSERWVVELYPPWGDDGPVSRVIRKWPAEAQLHAQQRVKDLEEFGPYELQASKRVKKVQGSREGLYELRKQGTFSFRLLFTCVSRTVVMVHACQKKRWRLNKRDIKTADARAAQAKRYYEERAR